MYVCLSYRFANVACWNFTITQLLEMAAAIYMYACVFRYWSNVLQILNTYVRFEVSNTIVEPNGN